MRSARAFNEKLQAMLNNPFKRGFTADCWLQDGWFCNVGAPEGR